MIKEETMKLIEKFIDSLDISPKGRSATSLNSNLTIFIEYLYKQKYVIISPEEMKKINGMTILAEVHGMNPFNPSHEVKEKVEES